MNPPNELEILINKNFPHLYPFQVTTVINTHTFFNANETHSCYCANEQGLGKSITTIATLDLLFAGVQLHSKVFKAVIVCPAIMRFTWEAELKKFSKYHDSHGATYEILVVEKKTDIKKLTLHTSVVIVSYDISHTACVLPVLQQFLKSSVSALVADEAHALKTSKAKRTKAVLKTLFPAARYKLLLSGTPMTKNVVDCYSTFSAILPRTWPDFYSFATRYSFRKVTPWATEWVGLRNPEELKEIIRSKFFIRYTKEQVLPELPEKQFTDILLPETLAVVPKAKSDKDKLTQEIELMRQAILHGKDIPVPKTLAEHRKLQGLAKAEEVALYVEDLLTQDIPVVLFGWHHAVIDRYIELLRKYTPVVITGDTPAKNRFEGIKLFQEGATNLFVGNMQAAGVGITLTRSSNVVIGELPWTPAIIAQGIDRVHRIGQRNQVVVHTVLVKNSLDTTIAEVLMSRVKEFKRILD